MNNMNVEGSGFGFILSTIVAVIGIYFANLDQNNRYVFEIGASGTWSMNCDHVTIT
jgi:hypothetical protein